MNIADISTTYKSTTILDGALETEAIELEYGQTLVGIFHPIMDVSAVIGIKVSEDGVAYVPLEDGLGAIYAVGFDSTIAGFVPILSPETFLGFRFLKLTVPDAQVGDKVLRLAVRPIL